MSEAYKMDRNDLPLGFGFALAQNPEAMKRFSNLAAVKQAEILEKAHGVSSKGEMQALVSSILGQGQGVF